jgi:hypothetical protein
MEEGVETRTGSVHGKTITLDEEAPELEGRRVRVRIEPIEDAELELTAEENARLWAEWREREASEGSEPIQGAGVEWE